MRPDPARDSEADAAWSFLDLLSRRVAALVVEEIRPEMAKLAAPAIAPQARNEPGWLSTKQAAAHTGIARSQLEAWRQNGSGPPFVRVGARIRYSRDALEAWMRRR